MNSNGTPFQKNGPFGDNLSTIPSKQIIIPQTLAEADLMKEKNTVTTYFERQQNEAVILYNSDSTTLQMALANRSSVPAMKHQFMQDLITLSKKPTARENTNPNMSFGLNQIIPIKSRSLSDSEIEELINGGTYDGYDEYSNERFEEEDEDDSD